MTLPPPLAKVSSVDKVFPIDLRQLEYISGQYRSESLSSVRYMSTSAIEKQVVPGNEVQRVELLTGVEDNYEGIILEMEKYMDSVAFLSLLRASLSQWKQQGKRAVWIKLPIELVNLVEPAVKEGFKYHHAETDYLMLVKWLSQSADTIPKNASHRVGISAFVMNEKREVLVVQEKGGKFKGTGVWKFPTGVVDEGEDISEAAMREVKEETGIDTEFVEILAFRQSHRSFFTKSDLLFVCMLRPRSFDIHKQDREIEAAQCMPLNDYTEQPFIQKHDSFRSVAKVCLTKLEKEYAGFSPVPRTTASGKTSYLYFNSRDLSNL
ncbi:nudix hydrolase homolog 2, ARABIDOPSIS THALIANA NUDIX HYDROLASE HOMOLOG 2 [Hibiscus trionum]|uniref:Nudix hydrolase homolog 2, ARABIDOPSIS THALIANA NUDIX HYDROLASE HOMOLOG 2 n=1 Tax=Hibiscus trionum TaxID=183268 RepID=A0A9W7H4K2_HIBTR|nr:nudix hydrolase homolog 2, ARABIDOPSIS THALIANA NUDIX HYDROLASE HOMOLOG 2 [Hibiscus trionum]